MKATKEVYQLIQSMSASEKRSFRQLARRNSKLGRNNYLKLFEAIERYGGTDEDRLRKKLRHESFVAHLPSTRYQLARLIVHSLYLHQTGKSQLAGLQEMVRSIAILFDRGLYKLGHKFLKKARVQAEQFDRHLELLEILDMERMTTLQQQKKNIEGELTDILEREQMTLAKLNNEKVYADLNTRMTILVKQQMHAQDAQTFARLQEIMTHSLLKSERQALTFRAKSSYLQIHALHSMITGRKNKTYAYQKRLVELWNNHPQRISFEAARYKAILTNYLNACIAAERLDEIQPVLQSIKALPSDSLHDEIRTFENVYYLELTFRLQTGSFDDSLALIDEIEHRLNTYAGKLSEARVMIFHYNIMLLLFFSGDFARTLQWLEKILSQAQIEIRRDIQECARLLLPVLHVELGSLDLLDSLVRSAQRYLKRRKRLDDFVKTYLAGLNKIAATTRPAEIAAICRQLHAELTTLVQGCAESIPLGRTELLFWLESKADEVSIVEVFKRKVAERGLAQL